MNNLVTWSVLAFALVLWPGDWVWAQPVFGPSQNPLAGSRVFGTKGCAKCHAVNGVGGTVGPDLGRIARSRSFYDLASAMWNHLPRMVEQMAQQGVTRPQLKMQETADLIGFLYTLNYFDAPGNPEVGARYFAEKRCITCHQVSGSGGVVGGSLDFFKKFGSPLFVAAALWNHGPQMMEAMKSQGLERPAFIGPELHDLLAYLVPASAGPGDGPVYVLPPRPPPPRPGGRAGLRPARARRRGTPALRQQALHRLSPRGRRGRPGGPRPRRARRAPKPAGVLGGHVEQGAGHAGGDEGAGHRPAPAPPRGDGGHRRLPLRGRLLRAGRQREPRQGAGEGQGVPALPRRVPRAREGGPVARVPSGGDDGPRGVAAVARTAALTAAARAQ